MNLLKDFNEKEWLKDVMFVLPKMSEEQWTALLVLLEGKKRAELSTLLSLQEKDHKEEIERLLNPLETAVGQSIMLHAQDDAKKAIKEAKTQTAQEIVEMMEKEVGKILPIYAIVAQIKQKYLDIRQ